MSSSWKTSARRTIRQASPAATSSIANSDKEGASMTTRLGILTVSLGFVCMATAAIAHHGFDTEYDANKKLTLTGVVQKVEWQNPHMRVYVDVTDSSGKVTTWNLEMTSP